MSKTRSGVPYPRGGVLAVLRREADGAFLLVRRANAPDAGLWGFPGGKIEAGENLLDAAERELEEETALRARGEKVLTALDSIHRDPKGGIEFHYIIVAVKCVLPEPAGNCEPQAGDDALEAAWFTPSRMQALEGQVIDAVLPLARLAEQHA